MAYIGNSPANVGNYQIVDDISSSFNGSTTSFALASGSITITPAKSGQLLVGVNGVMQEPDDTGTNGFKVSGSNIVFSSAPASGDTFWAVYQGQNVDIGTPSDGVVDTAQLADGAVTAAKIADGTVVAAEIATNAVTTVKINADAVTGAKIADDAIDSEHYADGSIDNAHIADDAIDSEHYADGSIDTAHIGDLQVTTAKIAADAITAAKIADDVINSEHYAAASIDNEHLADNAVDTAEIADNAITLAKMAGGTDGNIISYDASGDPVAIATGTDGQVLTSTGAGSPPAFEDVAAGGASVLGDLTDVSMDIANLVDGLIIQTDSNGSAPTHASLNGATDTIGIGKDVFTALTTGDKNIGIGNNVMTAISTGEKNVCIGPNVGEDLTGNRNVLIGAEGTAKNMTSGDDNIKLGYDGDGTQTGNQNICIGRYTNSGATSAAENIAIGYSAGKYNGTGNSNTAVGTGALYHQGSGSTHPSANTAIGQGSMAGAYGTSTGHHNTAIGGSSLTDITTGNYNSCIGYFSGTAQAPSGSITTAENIMCLGHNDIANLYCNDTSISSSDERDKTDIENFTAGLDFVNQMRPIVYRWDKRSWYAVEDNPSEVKKHEFIATEGQTTFVIEGGYTASNSKIEVEVNNVWLPPEDFTATDNANVVLDTGVAVNTEVDIRFDSSCTSQNILDAVPDGSLKKPKLHIGFISQEVQPLEQALGYSQELADGTIDRDTELVCNTNEDKTAMGLKYERFVPILVNAIKELSTKNEELLARITTLENA